MVKSKKRSMVYNNPPFFNKAMSSWRSSENDRVAALLFTNIIKSYGARRASRSGRNISRSRRFTALRCVARLSKASPATTVACATCPLAGTHLIRSAIPDIERPRRKILLAVFPDKRWRLDNIICYGVRR